MPSIHVNSEEQLFRIVIGGSELVVWNLACGLTELGHKVLLFAPKGSQTPPKGFLIETPEPALKVHTDWVKAERDMYEVYRDYLKDFEGVIHGHGWFGFEYLLKQEFPSIKTTHTHHGGMSWASKPVEKMNLHGISKFMAQYYGQVLGLPEVRFVYNGIDTEMYKFQRVKGDRLIYVGRISKFKQPHVAIEVARRLNLGLDIVGGTFVDDFAYLNQIKNMCDGTQIKFHPDASHDLKIRLLGDAKCLLFPSAMGEPFGLVAVEAGSCGTPVVALRDGAIPELVLDGINGYVCNNVEELASAVGRVHAIKPETCRQIVEQNFTRQIMAERYLKNYRDIIDGKEW